MDCGVAGVPRSIGRMKNSPAGMLLVVMVTMTGCGGSGPTTARPSPVTSPSEPTATPAQATKGYSYELRKSDIRWVGAGDPYNAVTGLDDGRRVAMHYRRGLGLYEQHSDPAGGKWTKPRLIYGTKTEACQGIRLRAFGGTVAATADFGKYCSDGEPPTESIAAVGVGSTWNHHLTRNFDGWERISANLGGKAVTFSRGSATLRWTRAGGFR
jgi:hypothetical protein